MTNPLLKTISSYAEKALLYEVSLTPKPGLVDRYSNGAHHDMDFYTFLDSIVSLAPFFINMQRLVIIIKEMLLYFLNSYERLEKKQKKQCYTQQMV